MKVVSLTTVFPNAAQPTHGMFVFERLRHLAERVPLRVVAPVSWRVRGARTVRWREERQGVTVDHPWFFYTPAVLKVLDGCCLFLSAFSTMRRVRRTFAFDVIDAHFAFPEGFAAALFAALYDRPFTITMRGTEIPVSADPHRRRAIGWALRRADRVIAVAQPLAEYAMSLGVAPERVAVVANGVDTTVFAPRSRAEARRAVGMDGGPIIVSVGHLSPRKGFQRVIRVLPALLKTQPNLRFVIVGGEGAEASNKAALEALVDTLGLREHVLFAGAQPPARVAEWLNAADAFVLASDYEGCPNVVLEALACGRPVVASRVGHVEHMVPSYAGILVDDPENDDELTRALDRVLQERWDSKRIREYAETQSWTDVATRVIEQWRLAAASRDGAHAEYVSHEKTLS